jgi:hypothetical protein
VAKIMQILKSDDVESRERHVRRLRKQIDDLNIELQINLDALETISR